jgi:ABC-2 type transport system ATP-binding protein
LGEALEVARRLPEVSDAAVFGDGLHVTAPSAEEAELAVRKALAAQGIGLRAIQRVTPSLEDAFISAVARAQGA